MAYSSIVQPYVDALNRILNTTVSESRLSTVEGFDPTVYVITRFENRQLLPLELRGGKWLYFRQLVTEEGDQLNVLEARYVCSASDDPDAEAHHHFRWEYLREPPTPQVPYGHLHVYAGDLQRIHFPTRRLSLEQILWLLIQEWGVSPRDPNWYEILKAGHLDFLRPTQASEQQLQPFP
ncbi:MAG: hypothetical protein AAB289_06355 [Chloroflexota bacterium]